MPDSQQKLCFLFTKQFPFGPSENYLLHELPFLIEHFDKVVAVPYDEYNYLPQNLKVNLDPRLEVFQINKVSTEFSLLQKIKRELIITWVLVSEIFVSRERKFHIRDFRKLLGGLRHIYLSAAALSDYTKKQKVTRNNTVFYHYWLHRGVLISMLSAKYQHGARVVNVARGHTRDMYHKSWNEIVNRHEYFLPFEKEKWNFLDRVYPISEHAYRFVQRVLPQHLHKAQVARLGVFSNSLPSYYPPQVKKQIVTCSIVNANKRNHLLPEILKHLPYNFKWTHFGSGTEESIQHLRELCEASNGQIEFDFRGPTPNAEILDFYHHNRIDLFFTLSLVESLPVSLMEAAAAGIPMVSTEVVATPEIVDCSNGYLMPVQFDPQEVAARIKEIFENEELWKAKSKAARKMFEERYDAQKNFTAFAQEIRQLIKD